MLDEKHVYGRMGGKKKMKNESKYKNRHAKWRAHHPEEVIARNRISNPEINRKGGKYYEHHRQSQMRGIPHEKTLIRQKHQRKWTPFKQIIAPNSELHHQWQPGTANYDGVALVEKNQHHSGIIDVIQILEGEITLFTEVNIKER